MYTQEKTIVSSYRANCYFLESANEVLVIDPGDDPELLLGLLEKRKVIGIVLTHCHSDHIGAVNELVEATGAPVMIAEKDDVGVADPHLSGFDDEGSDYVITQIDRVLKDNDTISWGEDQLKVITTPGHTPGSICLYDEKGKKMFTGDTLFAGGIGRTDYVRGNLNEMRSSLQKLGRYPTDIKIYPGHGASSDLLTEKQRNPWLEAGG